MTDSMLNCEVLLTVTILHTVTRIEKHKIANNILVDSE
jgi:hypothetical protein